MKNNLKELRTILGIKQSVLARELKIKNQASISEWETGRKSLSVENAIMFAQYYGVTVGCVVGTEPIPEGYPDAYVQPVFYSDLVKKSEPEAVEPKKKRQPFTAEQLEFLDEWKSELVAELKEDTSSSSASGA